MKKRIEHIINSESLSNIQFAQALDISPASVTHILSGRNNPSLDIVTRIARKYPHYNLRWLLLGEGAVYNTSDKPQSKTIDSPNLFSNSTSEPQDSSRSQNNCNSRLQPPAQPHILEEKLIVCLPDGTYKEYVKQ